MADTSITSTTAAVMNPAITSDDLIVAREAVLAFSGTTSHTYTDKGVGASIRWSSVGFPNSGAARTKSEGNSNTITKDATTETAVTLTINQHNYSAFEVEEFEDSLTHIPLAETYRKMAGYVVNLAVDDVLAGLPDNFSQTVGTLLVPLSDSDIVRGIQYLNDANAPQSDRFLVIAPATVRDLQQIDRYASSDFNRGGMVNLLTGEIGNIYSLRVLISTNVEGSNSVGHDNSIHHRDAIALGMRMRPRERTFDDISNLSTTYAVSVIFGAVETRDDHGVWAKGS